MRPAPMLRCPTSELPICPSGRPTAAPDASSVVHGMSRNSTSKRGVAASAIALYSRSLRQPKPSRTMRMRKGRVTRRAILTRLLLALEHHADVVGRAGLEVDRGDAHQLPSLVSEAVELLGAS